MLTSMRSRELLKMIADEVAALPENRESIGSAVVALAGRIWNGDLSEELEPEEQVALSAHLVTCLERRTRSHR